MRMPRAMPSAFPRRMSPSGIVYVEAWSYGKPVVCGTAPASRELVENNVTGVYGPGAQKLGEPAASFDRSRSIASASDLAGLRHQLTHYTAEQMVGTHLKAWGPNFQTKPPCPPSPIIPRATARRICALPRVVCAANGRLMAVWNSSSPMMAQTSRHAKSSRRCFRPRMASRDLVAVRHRIAMLRRKRLLDHG